MNRLGKWLTPGRIALGLFLALVVFGVAAWYAPRVVATAWREPLRVELSRALGRQVSFGDVRYMLFPYPGLSASDLVIPDDPAYGLEPLAYVTELQVGLRWLALAGGRFEISSVRMNEASVNLALHEERGWNAGLLLENLRARAREKSYSPELEIRGGRLNFRQGTRKSAFYMNAVDLDVQPPPEASGLLEWSFEASPARTDRSEQGFGRFTGQGQWRPTAGRDGVMNVEMELERSVLTEVATVVAGRDLGLQGRVTSKLRINGPLSGLTLRGRVDLEGLDRRSLTGRRGQGWSLPFEGTLDLTRQSMELHTVEPKNAEGHAPFQVRLAADSILTNPKWAAGFSFDAFEAKSLLELARRLGARVPDNLEVEGALTGPVSVPREGDPSGELELANAQVRLGGAGPVKVANALLRLSGGALELLPAQVESPTGSVMNLEGKWAMASEALSFKVGLKDLAVDDLKSAVAVLPGVPVPPVLGNCGGGTATGEIRFARKAEDEPAPWSGDMVLAGVECAVDGSAAPLRVRRSNLSFRGEDWSAKRVAAQWGGLALDGAAEYRAAAARKLQLALHFATLDAEALTDVLEPTFVRRRSFLDRTFRRGGTVPAWLAGRRLEATVSSKQFILDGRELERLSAKIYWDGTRVEIPQLDVHDGEAWLSGRLAIRIDQERPSYHLLARLADLRWQDARLDADIDLKAEGLTRASLDAMRAAGQFQVRGLEIGGQPLRNAAGCYDYDGGRAAGSRLRLRCLEAVVDGELLTGTGGSAGEGRLALELASPRRSLRLSGSAWPVILEAAGGATAMAR